MYEQIRETYEGPLAMATDLVVFNITKEDLKVREAIVNPATWPAPPPSQPEPPDHTLLTPRTQFINSGMMAGLVDDVVGPQVADFKKRRGVE